MITLEELLDADEPEYSVRERVEAFYKGTDAIGKFAEEVMVPILRGQLDLEDRELAVTGLYYRMYLWIKSVISLNNRLHFQATATATRALFELLLDLKLLASDTDGTMISKFHAFPEVERFRVAKDFVAFSDEHPDVPLEDEHQRKLVELPGKESQIEEIVVNHWGRKRNGRPNRPDHWSGMNIRERAKKFGASYEAKYLYDYRLGCWSSHSGSTNYAGLKEETLETKFGVVHRLSQGYFLEATVISAKVKHISEAVEGFDAIIDELERVPGAVLTEIQISKIEQAKKEAGLV